ncbi:Pterin-4-alpha-carbinolamine dehydratase [Pseudonocardia sp. Ae168_Ps1]|jgi:4a-hydroxytetrahydrobiopterin dehydratase|uniref:4a-hydroxytetrahydrobiopterin dehydratase n=1 Tax=unclassified Pseudonocardia TaxID=2619320 RepID=UPI0001FFE558|nr:MULTISPECIES: 4a-hydroxytetrahydrobiopterin dehydratase [unclassified Pseudonocardia]ALE74960.1 pterin-4-alpha-carbinolamine dehydratase [Pseudonocardia sp. EC080625-04]ALL74308.1 pterin-4-alpha-carbinolamine dehydratase [Pseudonocardia sp. EC080610-09]ALL81331.1 pterin-4-alpha-carbinolamine dehydratase [Pseudonocardia sp. EC080619-01]OLL75744.1 Pterin-4-alpha-carbinolamine dehydratase [Pseudonocardia sp. Ae150A_Ps1]OLL81744.1 Pterin-4-alpha-carbinolamine dehydratase [Pseudonocardia sp. Ae1
MATPLLTDAEITDALRTLPGWDRDGDSIVRTARLPDFVAAVSVVDRVADDAEAADHHPDIDIRYNTLTFRLSTHSEGGLTAKDTGLAGQISDRIATAGG